MSVPLLGFGFGSSGMLWFLLAAGIPVLIHLWNRRRFRRVRWAAMEYLLAAMRRNRRRLLVHQWLLLLLRMGMIVLLTLAVAEPYLQRLGRPLVSRTRTLHLFVLDNSLSMGAKAGEETAWSRALAAIEQQTANASPGDGFALVLLARPAKAQVALPVFDRTAFLAQLRQLQPATTEADLLVGLQRSVEVIAQAQKQQPRFDRVQAVFLTDMQHRTWSTAAGENLLPLWNRLQQQATLVLHDVGVPQAQNLSILACQSDQQVPLVGRQIDLQVRLRNFGDQDRRQVPLRLLVDGVAVATQEVDLPAGEEVNAPAFRYAFPDPGDHLVELRLGTDDLPADNHRYLVLPVREQWRVLCIDGRPSTRPYGGATGYLVAALESQPGGGTSPIQVEVAPETALSDRPLAGYDVVFLCNVAQFTRQEARLLSEYVRGGGGLVIFLGDQVLGDNYNQMLYRRSDWPERLLPGKLEGVQQVQAPSTGFVLDPLDYRHPILRPFQDNEDVGLLSSPIYRYFRVQLPEESTARVALAFTNGDPLIVEERRGWGEVILVTTSAEPGPSQQPWNLMPLLQNYLPLVREIAAAAVSGRAARRNLQVGQPLELPAAVAMRHRSFRVRLPDGRQLARPVQAGQGEARWSFDETWQVGSYEVTPAPDEPPWRFAVNLDAAEGDLRRLSPERLQQEILPEVRWNFSVAESVPGSNKVAPSTRHGLQGWLLWGALGLFCGELVLLWYWAGKGR